METCALRKSVPGFFEHFFPLYQLTILCLKEVMSEFSDLKSIGFAFAPIFFFLDLVTFL